MGGAGDEIDAEIARTGMSAGEIAPKVYLVSCFYAEYVIFHLKIFHKEGKLVRIPGLPAMYDYEFFPQYYKVWPT